MKYIVFVLFAFLYSFSTSHGSTEEKHFNTSLFLKEAPFQFNLPRLLNQQEMLVRGYRGEQLVQHIRPHQTIKLSVLPPNVPIQNLDMVSAVSVNNKSVFGDIAAGLRDIAGGQSETLTNAANEAKQQAIEKIQQQAHQKGATHIYGLQVQVTQGGAHSSAGYFTASASGQAVRHADVGIQPVLQPGLPYSGIKYPAQPLFSARSFPQRVGN